MVEFRNHLKKTTVTVYPGIITDQGYPQKMSTNFKSGPRIVCGCIAGKPFRQIYDSLNAVGPLIGTCVQSMAPTALGNPAPFANDSANSFAHRQF